MIVVSPLQHLNATAAHYRPSHILTLLSPGHDEENVDPSVEQHLRLYFHDIDEVRAGLLAPDHKSVRTLLDFARGWVSTRPMLIHCWAGISRSSAAAFMIACARNPGRERDIAGELRRRAPFATPNRLMVVLADDLLQRSGRMVEALERIGRGAEAFQGSVYELPVSLVASTSRISTPPS